MEISAEMLRKIRSWRSTEASAGKAGAKGVGRCKRCRRLVPVVFFRDDYHGLGRFEVSSHDGCRGRSVDAETKWRFRFSVTEQVK